MMNYYSEEDHNYVVDCLFNNTPVKCENFSSDEYRKIQKLFEELKADADLKKAKYPEAEFELEMSEDNLRFSFALPYYDPVNLNFYVLERDIDAVSRKRYYILEQMGMRWYDAYSDLGFIEDDGYPGWVSYKSLEEALCDIKFKYENFWYHGYERFPRAAERNAFYMHKYPKEFMPEGRIAGLEFDEDDWLAVIDFLDSLENKVGEKNVAVLAMDHLILKLGSPHSESVVEVSIKLDMIIEKETKTYDIEAVSQEGDRIPYKASFSDINKALNEVFCLVERFSIEESNLKQKLNYDSPSSTEGSLDLA